MVWNIYMDWELSMDSKLIHGQAYREYCLYGLRVTYTGSIQASSVI